MRRQSVSIKVEVLAGSSITSQSIPEMIALANRVGVPVEASLNGVTTIAHPGDDEIDLALAWEHEIGSKGTVKVAMAWRGREMRLQNLRNTTKDEGGGR